MLSCRQVAESSSALLDGQLGARKRMAVRMHLLMCVHCRRLERQLRGLVAALRRRELTDPVDPAFVQRIVDRLDSFSGEPHGPHSDPSLP